MSDDELPLFTQPGIPTRQEAERRARYLYERDEPPKVKDVYPSRYDAQDFGGETFEEPDDGKRLRRQLNAVRTYMEVGWWRTLREVANAVGAPEASVSARLRDLRKAKHGGYTIERRRVPGGNGLHEYRMVRT